jgi:hypothetical protein
MTEVGGEFKIGVILQDRNCLNSPIVLSSDKN